MQKTAPRMFRIVFVLLLFWGVVLRYMMLIPPFEGSDEREHLGYVTQLRSGSFPDPRTSMQNLAVQASAQAPLHYILATLWSRLAPDYTWDGELPDNPWRSYVRPLPGNDNPNFTLFGPDQLPYAHNPTIGVSVIWLRFVSAFEGILAVALAYTTTRLLLPGGWTLFATILFAFNSVLIQIFALLTNDAAAILFGAFCTYRIAVLLRREITPRALLLSGVVLGLGVLTKLSVLVFVPVAGMVVLLRDWPDWKTIIRHGLILALPVALIGGPWYLYQGIAYGDPLGIQPHLRMNWAHIPPRSLAQAFQEDGLTPLLTLWSGYAWGLVTTQNWVYVFNVLLIGLGLFGYVRAFRRLWHDHKRVIVTLSLIWVAVLIAYLRWWTMFTFMNGRHLLPGYLALMILVTLGIIYGWKAGPARFMRLAFSSLTVFVAWVIVGNVTLVEAFQTITFPPDQAPALDGSPLQFGEAAFMGYKLEPSQLQPDEPIKATLCWQSLREDGRLPVPYAFAFQLVSGDTIYAKRESYPGMGKYTNWQPGRAFCDWFNLDIEKPFAPAHGYQVVVTLFDPQTTEVVPETSGSGPFDGWVAAPGPALSSTERDTAQFNFDGVYLLDYVLRNTADGIDIETHWGTGTWQPRAVTFFIHVVDSAGTLPAQLDMPLGGDIYPSFLWGQDERTFDQTYHVTVGAGDYTILAGLYDSLSINRLLVTGGQGETLPDGRVQLGEIHVDS